MMFRHSSTFYGFLDKLKKQGCDNLAEILSTWRLNRKVMLTEEEWPEILSNLVSKDITVLALTQMNTGKFGKIDSMEKWRATELEELNLNFSPYGVNEIETIIEHQEPATLYQGILFTGSHSKAAVLEAFIKKYHTPAKIMFIDDRLHQVESIADFCNTFSLPYYGYHYLGASTLPYDQSMDFGSTQTQMILNQKWSEDNQTNKIMSK